jgi:hypothetical protein
MPRHQGRCSRLSVFTLLLAAAALPALGQGLVPPPPPPNQPKGALSPLANARAIRLAPGVATIARAMPAVLPLHANTVLEDIKRTPIPHQPFQLMDPKTRRIVGPSDNITLPDGRVVPAGAYYKDLNALEAWLNGAGHTLKNKEALPVLRRTAINATLLNSQAKHIGSFHKVLPKIDLQRIKPTAGAAPMGSQIQSMVSQGDAQKLGLSPQQYQDGLKSLSGANLTSAAPAHLAKAAVAPLFKPAGAKPNAAITAIKVRKPIHQTYPFDFEVGSAGTFQAYLRGKGTIDGEVFAVSTPPTKDDLENSESHFAFHGDATAGGAVFNQSFTLATATADFTSSAKSNSAKMDVSVLGQSIFHLSESAPAKWEKTSKYSKGCDVHTTIPVPIGPLTLTVKLGVQGEAGLEYGVGLYGGLPMVRAWVDPYVHSSVYAQAGIGFGGDYLGLSAGVGANMTLLNNDMEISGEVGVYWFFAFGIKEKLVVHNKLEMLSGQVYAFVTFGHPCLPDVWNACPSTLRVDLWSWPGLKLEGDLFALDLSRPL